MLLSMVTTQLHFLNTKDNNPALSKTKKKDTVELIHSNHLSQIS